MACGRSLRRRLRQLREALEDGSEHIGRSGVAPSTFFVKGAGLENDSSTAFAFIPRRVRCSAGRVRKVINGEGYHTLAYVMDIERDPCVKASVIRRALVKECPHCKLVNQDIALRCDCGYDFPSGSIKLSYLTAKDRQLVSKAGIGLLVILILSSIRDIIALFAYSLEHWHISLILLGLSIAGLIIWLLRPTRF